MLFKDEIESDEDDYSNDSYSDDVEQELVSHKKAPSIKEESI